MIIKIDPMANAARFNEPICKLKGRDSMKIRLFFDVVSPYSWIGFEELLRLSRTLWRETVSVELVPFFLGGVMKGSQNRPPGENAVKAQYMLKDLERLGRLHGLSFSFPPVFPALTIKAQRCLTVLYTKGDQKALEESARSLWLAYWGGGNEDITSDEVIRRVLGRVLPVNMLQTVMDGSQTPETKKILEDNTNEALKLGAFGAPFFECNGEVFFGSDRFDVMALTLGLPFGGPRSKM